MTVAVPEVDKSVTRLYCANSGDDAQRWEEFVSTHEACTSYHRWNWKRVFENSFGWETFYLMAENSNGLCGILPLVKQEHLLFRRSLSSLPHVKEAGVVADSPEVESLLIQKAKGLAEDCKADHVEVRHRSGRVLDLPARTEKVVFVLPIQSDPSLMLQLLDKKTRNMVRKSLTYGMTAEFNTPKSLDDFYRVFCRNMRDLGTPVYSKEFFREIILAFPEHTHICVIRRDRKPIAAAFLNGFRDTVEAMWAASIREFLPLKPNMFLYWNLLRFAAERGFRLFDFGRCSVGSGTYEFKAQWTSQQIPLRWYVWNRDGSDIHGINRDGAKARAATWLWQRLPVPLTQTMGPVIVKYIPGV